MAAEEMLRFGVKPKAALLSHSSFGSSNEPSALKMRQTLALLQHPPPWLDGDGEMPGDVAPGALFFAERKALAALAIEHRLATTTARREYV